LANRFAAEIYQRRLNHTDGFKHIIKAININPGIADNWAALGYLYVNNGEILLAIKAFKQAWSLNPIYASTLYKFLVWASAIEELPDKIKLKYPKVYASSILAQEHKWNEILLFTDTVTIDEGYNLLNLYYDKCRAHFNLTNDDSSVLYAKKYVALSRINNMNTHLISRNGSLFQSTIISGDSVAIQSFDEEFNFYETDKSQKCSYINYEIAADLLQLKYDSATKGVLSLASGCINYSIIEWLNIPIYYRAQVESPEFMRAVRSLPKPPPLSQLLETPALW